MSSPRLRRFSWGWSLSVLFGLWHAGGCAKLDDDDCAVTRTCVASAGAAGEGGQGGAPTEEAAAGAPRED